MAELHVIGQLLSAQSFEFPGLFCKWTLEAGPSFRALQGLTSGRTHCDVPNVRHPCHTRRALSVLYIHEIDGYHQFLVLNTPEVLVFDGHANLVHASLSPCKCVDLRRMASLQCGGIQWMCTTR